jgi:hypothetical protein
MTTPTSVNIDETLKLKLSISRDIHSDLIRKVLGKIHYETVFKGGLELYFSSSSSASTTVNQYSDPNAASIHLESNSLSTDCSKSSSQDGLSNSTNSNPLKILLPTRSVSNEFYKKNQPGSPLSSSFSFFEFCLICDNSPSPIPGSPTKRSKTILPPSPTKTSSSSSFSSGFSKGRLNVSSLLTELNEYSSPGIDLQISRSTLTSPASQTGKDMTIGFHQYSSKSSSSSFDHIGMIKVEGGNSRNVSDENAAAIVSLHALAASAHSLPPTHPPVVFIPAMPHLIKEDNSNHPQYQYQHPHHQLSEHSSRTSSSFSTPTPFNVDDEEDEENEEIEEKSSTLSRSHSSAEQRATAIAEEEEFLDQSHHTDNSLNSNNDINIRGIFLRENSNEEKSSQNSALTDPLPIASQTSIQVFPSKPTVTRSHSCHLPLLSTVGSKGHPLVAKRNPKIERMINEAANHKQRSSSPLQGTKLMIGSSSSLSMSRSHSSHNSSFFLQVDHQEGGVSSANNNINDSFYNNSSSNAVPLPLPPAIHVSPLLFGMSSVSGSSSASAFGLSIIPPTLTLIDGIAGINGLNSPTGIQRTKSAGFSLFPPTVTTPISKARGTSPSTTTTATPAVNRLTIEEIIQHRKLMGRKMKDYSMISNRHSMKILC